MININEMTQAMLLRDARKSINTANGYIRQWRQRTRDAREERDEAEHQRCRLLARKHQSFAIIKALQAQRDMVLRFLNARIEMKSENEQKLVDAINREGDMSFHAYFQQNGFKEVDENGAYYVDGPYRVPKEHPETEVALETQKARAANLG